MATPKKGAETAPETQGTTAEASATPEEAPETQGTTAEASATPEKVAQARYSSTEFPLGGRSDREVVRKFDDDGVLEGASDGPLKPGERGIVVVNKGGRIDRSVRYELGLTD